MLLRSSPLLPATLLLAACATEAPEVATTEDEILGDLDVNACSASVEDFFEDAAFVARTIVSSDAFVACVNDAVATEYRRCTFDGSDGDPNVSTATHTRNALRASRSVNDISLTCDTSSGVWGSAGVGDTPGYYGDEVFDMHRASIDQANQIGQPTCSAGQTYATHGCRQDAYPYGLREVAATIIHENLHQHGYTHGGDGGPCMGTGYDDVADSMPWIVDQCLVNIVRESMTTCGDICPTRSDDDISSCSRRGRLQLVTELGATTCEPAYDPHPRGVGALHHDGTGLRALDMLPDGNRYGTASSGWLSGEHDDVVAVGNLDPYSAGGEQLLRSGWGIGVVGWNVHGSTASERTTTRALSPYGATLPHWGDSYGTWTLAAGDQLLGVGAYSSAAQYGSTAIRDEILIRNSGYLGILSVYGGKLHTRNKWSNGTYVTNGWTLRADDELLAQGDFNGDGQTDLLLRNKTVGRIGVLSRTGAGGSLVALEIRSLDGSDGWWGSWNIAAGDKVVAVGDFDGNGRDAIVVRSAWGLGLIGIPTVGGSGVLTALWLKPHGTVVSGWTLRSTDQYPAAGHFLSKTRDSLLVQGAGGITAVTWYYSPTGHYPSIHSWQQISVGETLTGTGGSAAYSTTHKVLAAGDFDGDGYDSYVFRSTTHLGVVGRLSADATFRLQEHERFLCTGSAPDSGCHDTLLGSWLLRKLDDVIAVVPSSSGADSLVLRSYAD